MVTFTLAGVFSHRLNASTCVEANLTGETFLVLLEFRVGTPPFPTRPEPNAERSQKITNKTSFN